MRIRPSNAIVKAFRAGFHLFVQRCRPRPVGSRLRITRNKHLSAACSFGKCPRALTARRNLAFKLSIAFVSGMKYLGPESALRHCCSVAGSGWGCSEEQLGQADLHAELRARVSTWPPLRLTRLRCERESVCVVSAQRFLNNNNNNEEAR